MYQALYRKYRPHDFSGVVGQEHITEILKNELKTGKIFHSYLFTGPRGTGKTSCAKILAKAVNCLNSEQGDACGECDSCKAIENGDVLDIVEIDAASNTGVDNIRDLKEQVNYTPTSSKYRVYIIDEVHMLSIGAFNALLKTLEEPPAHIIFILATTEVHKLPATILSRCQRFDFHRISLEAISGRIQYIAEKEGFTIDTSAADMIARLCDGGMRDALSTLDLCAARSRHITGNDVLQVCSLAGSNYCAALTNFIAEGNIAGALAKIDELHKNAVDLTRLCSEMITHYRNLMIAKTVKDPTSLIVCTAESLKELQAQSKDIGIESILNAVRVLADCLDRMSTSDRRTEFEMAIVTLCNPTLDNSPSALLQRLEKLERMMKYGAPITVTAPYAAAAATASATEKEAEEPKTAIEETYEPPIPTVISDKPEVVPMNDIGTNESAPTATETKTDKIEKFDAWADVIDELQGTTPLLAVSLFGSKAYLKGDTLLIDCEDQQFFSFMRGSDPFYRNQIKLALQTVVGRSYRLGPYKRQQQSESTDPLNEIINRLKTLEVPEN
ncbi:MAG: DNA polymerase III subunit gamma/tau [Ruminococcaceae bacterium]|nr:DNA polymerase III subunit gamma/tau [Oscillospiraceae bacterium]